MNTVVVDTDVVSFLFKNHPIGSRYEPALAGSVLLISFMTVAELERWAIQRRWNTQRIECADAWIAATAMLYGMPLVTHNRTDYLGVPGLTLVSHAE